MSINDAKLVSFRPEILRPQPGRQRTDPRPGNRQHRGIFIRGNGLWTFKPAAALGIPVSNRSHHRLNPSTVIVARTSPLFRGSGLRPEKAGQPCEVVYKIQSANVTTGQIITAAFSRKTDADAARIAVSTSNGLHWKEVWQAGSVGEVPARIELCNEVNGAYEILVKIEMQASAAAEDVCLKSLDIQTITQINSKTQPKLALGRNTVYVGAGEPTETLVFWPDLQGDRYKELIVDEKNIKTKKAHEGWNAVLEPRDPRGSLPGLQDGNARRHRPHRLRRPVLQSRPQGQGPTAYSTDAGKTWQKAWEATNPAGKMPWDLMHYQTVALPKPAGTRSVLIKYSLWKWGLYAFGPRPTTCRPTQASSPWK